MNEGKKPTVRSERSAKRLRKLVWRTMRRLSLLPPRDTRPRAKTWFWRTIVVGVATIVAAFVLVIAWDANGNLSDASVLQIVLAKAIVLSVGFYFTVNSVRFYRSSSHLAVVNRHREVSLRTFRAFAEGAGDDQETKSKVLLEATHAAFGQVPTGLASGSDGTNVLEVLDGATGVLRRGQ